MPHRDRLPATENSSIDVKQTWRSIDSSFFRHATNVPWPPSWKSILAAVSSPSEATVGWILFWEEIDRPELAFWVAEQ